MGLVEDRYSEVTGFLKDFEKDGGAGEGKKAFLQKRADAHDERADRHENQHNCGNDLIHGRYLCKISGR